MLEHIFKDYEDLKTKEKIDSFCNKENDWYPELRNLFLHKTHSEMYIIIKVETEGLSKEKKTDFLREIIRKWEKAVLEYINFDWEDKETRKYIKYNITLIIICNIEKSKLTEKDSIIKEEKSTNICRKIFLFCDNNENISKEELRYLPFYLEQIEADEQDMADREKKEKKLKQIEEEARTYLEKIEKKAQEQEND